MKIIQASRGRNGVAAVLAVGTVLMLLPAPHVDAWWACPSNDYKLQVSSNLVRCYIPPQTHFRAPEPCFPIAVDVDNSARDICESFLKPLSTGVKCPPGYVVNYRRGRDNCKQTTGAKHAAPTRRVR